MPLRLRKSDKYSYDNSWKSDNYTDTKKKQRKCKATTL